MSLSRRRQSHPVASTGAAWASAGIAGDACTAAAGDSPARPSRVASFASHASSAARSNRAACRATARIAVRTASTSSSINAPMPAATRAGAPNNAVTAPESPASSSALPCAVSITPGPDRPKRACGTKRRCSHAAASTDAPPNAAPVTIASVAMPARRTSNSARSARASAHSAALASCRRTPPESTSRITTSGRSSRARSKKCCSNAP